MLRPTCRAVVAMLVVAVCLFFGLAVDAASLMAVSIAGLVVLPISFGVVLIQRRLVRSAIAGTEIAGDVTDIAGIRRRYRERTGVAAAPHGSRRNRRHRMGWLLPGRPDIDGQWSQLDQYDHTVRWFVGEVPRSRGLYRLDTVSARWIGMFGLWANRVVIPVDKEVRRLADADSADGRAIPVGSRTMGGVERMDAASVRAYAAGDPWRMIAWRQSAHRGELMTRDGGRPTPADTLIVFDTWPRSASPARSVDRHRSVDPVADDDPLAACAASVMLQCESIRSAGGRVTVTDGVHDYDDVDGIARFLAAVRPEVTTKRADAGAVGLRERADHIVERLSALGPQSTAILFTPYESASAGMVTATAADGTATTGDGDAADAAATSASATVDMSLESMLCGMLPDGRLSIARRGNARRSNDQRSNRPDPKDSTDPVTAAERSNGSPHAAPTDIPSAIPSAISALAIAGSLDVAVWQTVALFSSGWWTWFAAALFTVIGIESSIPSARRRTRILRCLIVSLGSAMVGIALMSLRIRELLGSADRPGGLLATVRSLLERGAAEIYEQYVPIVISARADALLILVVAGVAVLLRLMLAIRSLWPICGLLPLVVMAVNYAWLGTDAPTMLIAACAGLTILLLWSSHGRRLPAPVPLIASALIAALVAALTPSAVVMAQRTDIPLGDSSGLFSNGAINPMVDLKRGINQTSATTAFSYTADRRLYFRLATLDDFDGDTWSFSERLSDGGGFYGGSTVNDANGTRRGSVEMREYSAFYAAQTPIDAYLDMLDGTDASDATDTRQPSIEVKTTVTIDALRSRFLPVPSGAVDADGTGAGWRRGGDAAIYSASGGTESGMTYTAEGRYLAPIASTGDFRRITELTNLKNRAEAARQRQIMRVSVVSDQAVDQYGDRAGDGADNQSAMQTRDGRLVDETGTTIGTFTQQGLKLTAEFIAGHQINGRRMILAMPITDDMSAGNTDGSSGSDTQSQRSDRSYMLDLDPPSWMVTRMVGSVAQEYLDQLPRDVYIFITAEGWGTSGSSYQDPYDFSMRTPNGYDELPAHLPKQITTVVNAAKSRGVQTLGRTADEQIAAMRYLVNYFTTNGFSYSLDAPDGSGRSNMEVIGDFLDRKTGYCAHYASALAVLGRAMGVKTRMVLGYAPGSGGSDGSGSGGSSGSYAVASNQLHSWVEAYIDGLGWMPFDVTPAADDDAAAVADSADDAAADAVAGNTNADGAAASPTTTSGGSSSDSTDDSRSGVAGTADPSGEATSSSDGNDSADTSDDNASTALDGSTGGWPTIYGWPTAYGWRALAAAATLAAIYVVLTAGLWLRRHRRARRYRLIRRGDDDSWRLAWRETADTAWDYGIRWSSGATDREIAALIGKTIDGSDDAVRLRSIIDQCVGRAVESAFSRPDAGIRENGGDTHGSGGGVRESGGGRYGGGERIIADVEAVRQSLRTAYRHRYGGAVGMIRRAGAALLPPSVVRSVIPPHVPPKRRRNRS